jgi:Cu(I)/Ag(I) efflux system membrane fusion protein
VLGPEAAGYFIIIDGLNENDLVVTKGAFKIDADLQIRGKASLMNPKGAEIMSGHKH